MLIISDNGKTSAHQKNSIMYSLIKKPFKSWLKTLIWSPIVRVISYVFAHIPKWFYYMFAGLTALGIWDIVGNEIYETRLKPLLRPPIVAFPARHRIDRSLFRVYSVPFYIKNRSSETHYSIEARVYIGDLEENFEKLEVESISGPEKKIPRYMADGVTSGPNFFAKKDKERKRFFLVTIAKLEPSKDKAYLLTFKSIRENPPKKKLLDVTIKIMSYSSLPGTAKIQLDGMPYKYFEMKKIQYFQFQRRKILIGIGPNPKVVWLLAKDVCSILDIQNVKEAFDSTHYDAKTILPGTYLDGSKKNVMLISDYAVRQLTKKAKSTKAKQFEEWISNNVIPWFKLNSSTEDEK